jgi:hypothetical protein
MELDGSCHFDVAFFLFLFTPSIRQEMSVAPGTGVLLLRFGSLARLSTSSNRNPSVGSSWPGRFDRSHVWPVLRLVYGLCS